MECEYTSKFRTVLTFTQDYQYVVTFLLRKDQSKFWCNPCTILRDQKEKPTYTCIVTAYHIESKQQWEHQLANLAVVRSLLWKICPTSVRFDAPVGEKQRFTLFLYNLTFGFSLDPTAGFTEIPQLISSESYKLKDRWSPSLGSDIDCGRKQVYKEYIVMHEYSHENPTGRVWLLPCGAVTHAKIIATSAEGGYFVDSPILGVMFVTWNSLKIYKVIRLQQTLDNADSRMTV